MSKTILSTKMKYLVWANNFVSDDEERPVLHGVRIESCASGGIFISATNGRIAGRFYDKGGVCDNARTLNVTRLKNSLMYEELEEGGDKESSIIINSDNVAHLPESEKMTRDVIFIDYIYPDLSKIYKLKPFELNQNFILSPYYLSLLEHIDEHNCGITLWQTQEKDTEKKAVRIEPYFITVNCEPNFLGVIMGMAGSIKEVNPIFLP
ncbi:MAG: hypothetical protein LBQ47_07680 [Endomicrobium sp.]|jgi:hypothetical protein|nr:hypothetical protein [Endomicrobium sp.]